MVWRLIEFALDGGVGFAEFFGDPGGLGLLKLFDGEGGEGEPFGGAELGREDDVEEVGVGFFAFDGAGDGRDGHDFSGDGKLGEIGAGGVAGGGAGVAGEDGFVAREGGADERARNVGGPFGGLGGAGGRAEGFGGVAEIFLGGAEDDRAAAVEFGADHDFAEGGEALGGVFEAEQALAEVGEGGEVSGGEARGGEIFEAGDASDIAIHDGDGGGDCGMGGRGAAGFFGAGRVREKSPS